MSTQMRKRLTLVAAVAAVYYATGRLSVQLAVPPGVATVVWPPSGLALAAILRWGRSAAIGVWLGSFLVNGSTLLGGSTHPAVALMVVAVIATGSTLQALLGATWIRRTGKTLTRFERAPDVFKFAAIELVVCMIAPALGVTALCTSGLTPWANYSYSWITWWLGDLIGVLVVTPFLLAWGGNAPRSTAPRRPLEALGLLLILGVIGEFVFAVPLRLGAGHEEMAFLFLPPLLWSAFRYGHRGATAVAVLISALAIGGTIGGVGLFSHHDINRPLIVLQTFAGVVMITGLAMAASLADREQTAAELRRARDELDLRVRERTAELSQANEAIMHSEQLMRGLFDHAPDAFIVVDAAGAIRRVNQQAEVMFGFERGELLGQEIGVLVPERFASRHRQHRANYTGAPRLRPMGEGLNLFARRKDGSEFPADIVLSPMQTPEGRLIIAIVRDITERQAREEQLRQSQQQLRALAARLQDAREEELTRIAREIHDNFGQILTSLKLDLAWFDMRLAGRDGELAALLSTKIASMNQVIDGMVKDIRRISSELRPNLLDDLGLMPAIAWLAHDFQERSGIRCDAIVPGEDVPLGERTATAVFRIYQEILTNVARHSGASVVTVRVTARDAALMLEVADNGRGITETEVQDRKSLGVLGMRERAAVFGGEVQIVGTAGQGTLVRVIVPVSVPAAPADSRVV